MKFLIVLSLLAVALAWEDKKMLKNWMKLKAMESCWGQENMKVYTVEVKKAIAKCSHVDAPELNLAPFRSTYRFVNTLMQGSESMENNQYDMMEMMMRIMMNRNKNSFTPYNRESSGNWMEKMRERLTMRKMMEMMENMQGDSYESKPYMSSYSSNNNNKWGSMEKMFERMMSNNMDNKMDMYSSNPESRMDQMTNLMEMFSNSRQARAAGDNLDLGDRLVEKLNEQKREMEAKVGNMTCVLKELKCLKHNNEIDIEAMKEDMKQYTLPSQWFGKRYEEILDTCYEMATNLPENVRENAVISGDSFGTINMGEVKAFMTCYKKAEDKLCMQQDIKTKIESNFGPLEEILEQTQLTEHQIFPLVVQLLHGDEMEYMIGDEDF